MLEKTIVKNALKILRACAGTRWEKTHGSAVKRGEPDVKGCAYGITVMIEFKRPGEEPDPLQDLRLNQWRAAGAITAVAYGSDQIGDLVLRAQLRAIGKESGDEILNERIIIPPDGARARAWAV